MFKLIAAVVTAFVLAVLLASPAVAAPKKPPGEKGSRERSEYCGNQLLSCVVDCSFFFEDDDAAYERCNTDCNGDFAACRSAARAATYESFEPAQSAGAMQGDPPPQNDLFGLAFFNFGEVRNACDKVEGGLYSRAELTFGCVAKACAGPGTLCLVYCIDGKCFGSMPDRPSGPLTLLGILQNGDNVGKGGGTGGNSLSDGGTGPGAPVPCNTDGCNVLPD